MHTVVDVVVLAPSRAFALERRGGGQHGLLFELYRIATMAVVGGAHGTGLHNVLEPASAGIPIVTGPDLGAFREALFWKE